MKLGPGIALGKAVNRKWELHRPSLPFYMKKSPLGMCVSCMGAVWELSVCELYESSVCELYGSCRVTSLSAEICRSPRNEIGSTHPRTNCHHTTQFLKVPEELC